MSSPVGNGALRYIGGLLGVPFAGPQFVELDVPPPLVIDVGRLAERGAAPGNSLGFMSIFLTDAHVGAGTIDVQTNIWNTLNAQLAEGSKIDQGTHGLWVHRSTMSSDTDVRFAGGSHALVRTILPGGSNSRDLIFHAPVTNPATVPFAAVNTLPLEAQWLYTPVGSLWITRSVVIVGAANVFHQLFLWAGVLGSTPPGAA